ncbi:haloalkane dehalogenase [Sulfitobacter aestuariivivens]|uniref:Alpha/beta fold hydrolase n=1 Tax=Sulfitobacter aestuariivivens TaxID=2766981 RepID=A0A927D6K6_9RHOB|nr:haloalkane dehalogenase [Sulfitobacter aestuariivivens]MBD3664152.1 alpha/beta fold hydrolase [Sulfitobacter aestuariivivens]
MDILRTPDERFAKLPGYDFSANYLDDLPEAMGARVHYVDEGPRDAPLTFLCLHGQPAWSYLYRRMIPIFTQAGHRVVAPDMVGFGKSDKPADEDFFSFTYHRQVLLAVVERLDLRSFVLVCQDWGGILGLSFAEAIPNRLSGLLVMNTAMPVGETQGQGFADWRAYSRRTPDMDIGKLIHRGNPHLTPEEVDAYNAPYPDARYKAAVRRFPELVMTEPEMDGVEIMRCAAKFWRNDWDGPTFMAVGMQDPVFGGDHMERLRAQIRGCPPFMPVEQGGHFVQEFGAEIAEAALRNSFGGV